MLPQQSPSQGRTVDVGGHCLYLECAGAGSPTVVFENGLGASLEEWAIIQPEVARYARTVVYDRAGLGRSEPGKRPLDGLTIVRELHAALKALGESGPYVLVGHSLGGVLIRLFTHLYPEEVCGLVFVDSSHPEQNARLPIPRIARAMIPLFRIMPLLARLRVPAFRAMARRSTPVKEFPPAAFERVLTYYAQPKHLSALVAEYGALDEILAQGRMTGGLGDRPIAVISAGTPKGKIVDAVRILHGEIAGLSTHATHAVVDEGTHVSLATNRDHAGPVIAAIRQVWDAARAAR